MRIHQLNLHVYGPLENVTLNFGPGLQIIYGPNESGKTLLIDALVKLLLGIKNIRDFAAIDRVPGLPEGHLRLHLEGREHILKAGFHLDKLVNITPRDLRNLYVVRNKDLEMSGSGYLQQLSDRLTGMDTTRMKQLRALLAERAGLTNPTSSAKLAVSRESGYLGRRYQESIKLIQQISAYLGEAKSRNFDQLEVTLAACQDRLKTLETEIAAQEKARERRLWEEKRELVDKYLAILAETVRLERFTPQARQELQDTASQVGSLQAAQSRDREELGQLTKELYQVEEQLLEAKAALAPLTERKPRLADLVRRTVVSGETQPPLNRSLPRAFPWVLMGIAILSLVFSVLKLLPQFFWLTPPLAVAGALFILLYNHGQEREVLIHRSKQQKLLQEAAAQGVMAETLQQLAAALGKEEDSLQRCQTRVTILGQRREDLERNYRKLEQALVQRSRQMEEARLNMEDSLAGAGVPDLQSFSAQVDEAHRFKANLEQVEDRLRQLLPGIGSWPAIFAQLPVPPPVQSSFSADSLQQLRREKDLLLEQIQQLQEGLFAHGNRLTEFHRDCQQAVAGEQLGAFTHLSDLELGLEALKTFSQEVEITRDSALTAIAALEELELEEAQRVADLLGEGQPLQDYFKNITGSRYCRLFLEQGEIMVQRADGIALRADRLSQGTYDQLYLALRVCLGSQLLGQKPGFFIMDDAFLCADAGRLREMFQLLADLAAKGWQILYFTKERELAQEAKALGGHPAISLNRLN